MGKKRGQAILSSLIYAIVEIVIVAMFIAAILVKVNSAVDDQTYQKRFYARDLALLTDSMNAAEGNFQMQHEIITKKPLLIDIYLKQGMISISDHAENEDEITQEASFLFGTSEFTKIQASNSIKSDSNTVQKDTSQFERLVLLKKEDGELIIAESNSVQRGKDVELKNS